VTPDGNNFNDFIDNQLTKYPVSCPSVHSFVSKMEFTLNASTSSKATQSGRSGRVMRATARERKRRTGYRYGGDLRKERMIGEKWEGVNGTFETEENETKSGRKGYTK